MLTSRWRSVVQDFEQITALRVMWQYLTDSAVAPLQKALVDTADPFCSNIDASFCENSVFVQVR
jgi:Zn-dependent M16 (insulinase) family peptidase